MRLNCSNARDSSPDVLSNDTGNICKFSYFKSACGPFRIRVSPDAANSLSNCSGAADGLSDGRAEGSGDVGDWRDVVAAGSFFKKSGRRSRAAIPPPIRIKKQQHRAMAFAPHLDSCSSSRSISSLST